MEKVRTIKLFKNYYKEFYVAQTFEVRDKINKVLKLIETQRMIPARFFRIIEGQKTPPKEIRHAEAIKKEYFKEKENKK